MRARRRPAARTAKLNALDRKKAVRPFSKDHQALVLSLAALGAHLPAAVATG